MLNLTGSDLTLRAAECGAPTIVRREGPRASGCIDDGPMRTGDKLDVQGSPIETAREATVTPTHVDNLNRLLEEHIRKDEARTGRQGLVLIERELLPHVHPRLRERVAAPVIKGRRETASGNAEVTMLVFPAEPYTPPATPAAHKGLHAVPRPRGPVHGEAGNRRDRPRAHVGAAAVAGAWRRALRARRAAVGRRRRTQHGADHERDPARPAAPRRLKDAAERPERLERRKNPRRREDNSDARSGQPAPGAGNATPHHLS